MIKLLALVLLTTACGTEYRDGKLTDEHKPKVDFGPYASYVKLFLDYSEEYDQPQTITDLIFRTADLSDPVQLGVCGRQEDHTPVITIDGPEWKTATETSRIALVFHELGHCVLRRAHITDSEPTHTLMRPYLMRDYEFSDNFDEVMEELFDPDTFRSWGLVPQEEGDL